MTNNLYEKALILKETLDNHPDVLLLTQYETLMSENADCALLLKEYRNIENELNALLEYVDHEAPPAKALRAKLSEVKYHLDCNAVVKRYNEQYKIVNKLYKNISAALFNPFCKKKGLLCQ